MSRLPKFTKETKPRMQSGAAVQVTTATVNGVEQRGKLAVCKDGRIYFGTSGIKYQEGELQPSGKRKLAGFTPLGRMYTVTLVEDEVLQTLKGMAQS